MISSGMLLLTKDIALKLIDHEIPAPVRRCSRTIGRDTPLPLESFLTLQLSRRLRPELEGEAVRNNP